MTCFRIFSSNYYHSAALTICHSNYFWRFFTILMVAFVALCPTTNILSQNDPSDLPLSYYEFISYEKNLFTGCEPSENYNQFLRLFDSLLHHKNFQIQIVHIGGSHIQADIYTNYIRQKLQSMDSLLPGARGIIFPYKLAGTNNPSAYRIDFTGKWYGLRNAVSSHHATWGVTGITAITYDTLATITMAMEKNRPGNQFSAVRILYNANNNSYTITLHDSSVVKNTTIHPEQDFVRFELKHLVDSISVTFKKSKLDSTALELYGMLLENEYPGIVYHSIGVNGASLKSYLRCTKFQQHLKLLKPDLVIISIGTNDTFDPEFDTLTFASRYDSLLQMIRNVNPSVAFLLTVPNDSYIGKKQHNINTSLAERVIYGLADKYGYKVWNFFRIMGGQHSALKWLNAGLMKPDRIHFTQQGYLIKGRLFLDAFMAEYWKWLESRFSQNEEK